MRRSRTQQEQQAHDIVGKGWSVGHNTQTTKASARRYSAIVCIEGKNKNVGCRDTRADAALLAVQAARYYGTLDWAKTVRWFKTMGFPLDGQETFGYRYAPKGKGWYVRSATTKAGTVMYIAATGYCENKKHYLKTVCSRKSKRVAVEHAIRAAKKLEYYNEAATILWLERNNMPELIALAQTKRRVA